MHQNLFCFGKNPFGVWVLWVQYQKWHFCVMCRYLSCWAPGLASTSSATPPLLRHCCGLLPLPCCLLHSSSHLPSWPSSSLQLGLFSFKVGVTASPIWPCCRLTLGRSHPPVVCILQGSCCLSEGWACCACWWAWLSSPWWFLSSLTCFISSSPASSDTHSWQW